MRTRLTLVLLSCVPVVLIAPAAEAQLDLRPPGASQPAATRPAQRPARPVARAPRSAPIPEPRPAEAGEGAEPGSHELATVPPSEPASAQPQASAAPATTAAAAAPTIPPVAAIPATPRAPNGTATATPPNSIDDAFRSTAAAAGRAPPIPETHPAIINAPLPPARPGTQQPPAAAASAPPAQAEAAVAAIDPPQIEAPFAEAPPRRFEGRAFSDKRYPVGRSAHLAAIRAQAAALRVPVDLADAVAMVESAYDPHAVGLVDEIGLMQVRPAIARQFGFEGTIQDLFEPETNIRLGVAYLAGAWERSGGNLCQALMKYRAGWDETQMSALSLEYCRRAVVHLTAIGSPLARGVTVPTGAATPPPGQRSTSRFNWQDHETRMRQIDQRFGGQNFGIIAREPQRP
jgi:soluble lytic murein transglycosylase-like protein